MSDRPLSAPPSTPSTSSNREQYQGQFDSVRLFVAIALCAAIIGIALYLR
jgi:hypothetical protein